MLLILSRILMCIQRLLQIIFYITKFDHKNEWFFEQVGEKESVHGLKEVISSL